MPEDRLDRSRRTLPEGYQFGDAYPCGRDGHTWPLTAFGVDAFCVKCGHKAEYGGSDWKGCEQLRPADESLHFKPWRAPHLNAAEQLKRSRPLNALDNLRSYSTFAASLDGGMTANVIEGEQFDTDRDPGDEA